MRQKFCLLMIVFFGLLLVACSNNSIITLPDADEITKLGEDCTALETMQVEAWKTFDPEEVRKVYTDDVVHFDGEPAYVGIDRVVSMSKFMLYTYTEWQMGVGESYVSADGCVGTWENWDIFGGTEENPALEFDYLESVDGKISFWRLMYDGIFGMKRIEEEFLQTYAEAWSSGDEQRVVSFYGNSIAFDDSLLGVTLETSTELEQYVEAFLAVSPGMKWELLIPYGEGRADDDYIHEYPHPSRGGVFGIHVTDESGNACMVEAFLMLTPDDDGKIVKHQVFYNEQTLIDCGWVK